HDIGKNIVNVVLSCNNYKIIDLGVMVPADKILDTAIAEKADAIGVSGLITPSLEEMVHVSKEMDKRGLAIPLLIGGATTSRAHTAVKIAPNYSDTVVHINDDSKAVTVVGELLNDNNRDYKQQIRKEYESFSARFLKRKKKKSYRSIADARTHKHQIDWTSWTPLEPRQLGIQVYRDFDLKKLVPFIDWMPFFRSWDLHGRFPAILDDKVVGSHAREVFADGKALLNRIIQEK